MTFLSDLSDELILEILLHLEYDKSSLLSTNLLSRHLFRLSQPYLYKHARLDAFATNYKRFLRSIKNNQALGSLVRDLSISWIERPGAEFPDEPPQVILSQLPRLQKFFFWVQTTRLFDSCLHIRPVSPACRYTLKIRSHYAEITDLAHFILKNRIHFLEVDDLALPNLGNAPRLPLKSNINTAPLESLVLDYSVCIPLSVLKIILTFPASLRSLSCAIPGTSSGDVLSAVAIYVSPRPRGPLKPSAVSRSLSPVAHSLETLELFGASDEWSLHDGSRLDLSAFSGLRHVHVASYLLFDSPEASPGRDGTYALLPSALEKLIIDFDYRDFILTESSEYGRVLLNQTADPSQYAWLSEIAAHKLTHFPGLWSMSLMEGRREGRLYRCKTWAMPEDLKLAFDMANIELCTRMRMF